MLGIEEFVGVQEFAAKRPEPQVNLAGFYTALGDNQEAEVAYRRTLPLQP